MSQQTALRQARNNVRITGYLKKKDLECKTSRQGVPMITGTLTIMTAPGEEHIVRVVKTAVNKDGAVNKSYTGFENALNEYVSIAHLVAKEGLTLEEAVKRCTVVSFTGQLSRNEYESSQTGEFVSTPCVTASFIGRADEGAKPSATFDVEAYIRSISPEVVGGDMTGRLKVEAIVPMYRGAVLPQSFVVAASVSDDFQAYYDPGCTASFNGNLVDRVETTVERASGFGRQIERSSSTFTHELEILGGEPPYPEESDKAFSREAIDAAMRVRELETIPAIRARSSSAPVSPTAPAAGFGTQRGPVSPASSAIQQAVAGFEY